jgi:hypothetical protein
MAKRQRTQERPAGNGRLRIADGKPIQVYYSLVVLLTVDDEADTGQLSGKTQIRGSVEVSQAEGFVDLGGRTFILEMDDGRCLKASATKGDPVSRQWTVVASGPKGFEPCA